MKEARPRGVNDGIAVIEGIVKSGKLTTGGGENGRPGRVAKGVGADVPEGRGVCDGKIAGTL